MKFRNVGMPKDNMTVYTLSFANDQVLIAHNYDDINYMTRKLIEEYQKCGPDININKTEYMCVGGEQRNLTLENWQEINCCAKYEYLGMEITNEGTLDIAIKKQNLLGKKKSLHQTEYFEMETWTAATKEQCETP